VPPHAIQSLVDAGADIAYGLYVWRHNLRRWSAYTELDLFGGYSLSLFHERARGAWGQVVDVAGLGMGCTLIRRNVLEALPFRLYEGEADDWVVKEYGDRVRFLGGDPHRPQKNMFCDDWMLALDAAHHGFTQRAHLGVACGHVAEEGWTLWPHPGPPELFYTERNHHVRDGA
jgi:hypothetical protein